ncbi:MAG: 30S ribosomal protein S3 [Candidatus Veblenbacteria bacterium]|nr:30S ribosomal protein S3 [Candidatus Veblenbacteria bacterium]MDZ4229627.1 30S ribosomal protein S3 [Candidatus Veblenbacteria bacterium]
MGQKVHPKIFRIGVIYSWKSRWFSNRNYREQLKADIRLRRWLKGKLRGSSVAGIEVERGASSLTVNIQTAKPGMVIGRGGAQVEELKKAIKQQFLKPGDSLQLNIQEVANPMLSAEVVAEGMALELERRMPFRRVMKQAMDQAMKAGALGVKVMVGGRLNGAEIARSEKLSVGKVPLHTLRADIDYSRTGARTTYGVIGVKVWINRGEVAPQSNPISLTRPSGGRGPKS